MAVTHLAQHPNWRIGRFGWPCGSPVGFRDNGGAHDLCVVTFNEVTGRTEIQVSADNGLTWTTVMAASQGWYSNRMNSVCQTSDGKVHLTKSEIDQCYARFTLTRDGSGHVTGWTQDVGDVRIPSHVPNGQGTSYHAWAHISVVTDGNGAERLFISSMVSYGIADEFGHDSSTNRGVIEAVCTHGLAPNSSSDFFSLAGVAGTQTTLYTYATTELFNSHDSWICHEQLGGSKSIWLLSGRANNETINDTMRLGYLERQEIIPDGANWTVGSRTEIGHNTTGLGWVLSSVDASATQIFVLMRAGSDGLRIDRINADGSYTANAIPVEAAPAAHGQLQVSADGADIWCSWVRQNEPAVNTGDLRIVHGHYDGSSWTKVVDTNSTYYTNTAYPMTSRVDGVIGGQVVLWNQQLSTEAFTATQFEGESTLGASPAVGLATVGTLDPPSGMTPVSLVAGPWSGTTTGSTTAVSVGAIAAAAYVLVSVVSNGQVGAPSPVTSISYAGLTFAKIHGGAITGGNFSVEFWATRSTGALTAQTLTVTTSTDSHAGVAVFALAGVAASNEAGTANAPASASVSQYTESFASSSDGSMLFGAFFDSTYSFAAITPDVDSSNVQTNVGYHLRSTDARDGGAETIGATLPGAWLIYHAGVEIKAEPPSADPLDGATAIELGTSGELSGIGAIEASTAIGLTAAGTISGLGFLGASATIGVATSGEATSVGAIGGGASVTVAALGLLSGVGELSGSLVFGLGAAGAFEAQTLSGQAGLLIVPLGALSGTGQVGGGDQVAFGVSGTLSGGGHLTASLAFALALNGALSSANAFDGSAPVSFGVFGTLAGAGALTGDIGLGLVCIGEVTEEGSVAAEGQSIQIECFGALSGIGAIGSGTWIGVGVAGVLVSADPALTQVRLVPPFYCVAKVGVRMGRIQFCKGDQQDAPFGLDCSRLLDQLGGDVTLTAAQATRSAGDVVLDRESLFGNTFTFWLSEGTAFSDSTFEILFTLSNGAVFDLVFQVRVRESAL